MRSGIYYILVGCLVAEVGLFAYFYWYGTRGMSCLHNVGHEAQRHNAEIALLTEAVTELEIMVGYWESDAFYKEKVAREQLQMARKDDVVYYVP